MVARTVARAGDELRDRFGDVEIVELTPELDVEPELERRGARVRALGVAGGDGTMASLVPAAMRHKPRGRPLSSRTMNHFTRDMGIDSFDHTARAVETGYAVATAGGSRSSTPRALGRTRRCCGDVTSWSLDSASGPPPSLPLPRSYAASARSG